MRTPRPPRARRSPATELPFASGKFVLSLWIELRYSAAEIKEWIDEITRKLARDVLLNQVHQGPPVGPADIGAFEAFYEAESKPPHYYLTLIPVSDWAAPDDDSSRNAERATGKFTQGHLKDGKLHVSLLTETKLSRFYLAEANVPEDLETIPLPLGEPIPLIAGSCSASDLWSALQDRGRIARLPYSLHKRGWKSPYMAIFQHGDGTVRTKVKSLKKQSRQKR